MGATGTWNDVLTPREGLEQFLAKNMHYYLGPTGIPDRIAAIGQLVNPIAGAEDMTTATGEVFAPGKTPRQRLDSGTRAATEAAGILATVFGGRAAMKAAQATTGGIASSNNAAARAVVDTLAGSGGDSLADPVRRKLLMGGAAAVATAPIASKLDLLDAVAPRAAGRGGSIFSAGLLKKAQDMKRLADEYWDVSDAAYEVQRDLDYNAMKGYGYDSDLHSAYSELMSKQDEIVRAQQELTPSFYGELADFMDGLDDKTIRELSDDDLLRLEKFSKTSMVAHPDDVVDEILREGTGKVREEIELRGLVPGVDLPSEIPLE